jgi:hypothetical protein
MRGAAFWLYLRKYWTVRRRSVLICPNRILFCKSHHLILTFAHQQLREISMKLKMSIAIALSFVGFTASAHTPVERMNCGQAQTFVQKHAYYWKDAGVDGVIRIFPVSPLGGANCGGHTFTSPIMERTLDQKHCAVGGYCVSY